MNQCTNYCYNFLILIVSLFRGIEQRNTCSCNPALDSGGYNYVQQLIILFYVQRKIYPTQIPLRTKVKFCCA